MKKAIWLIVPLIICLCGPVSAEFYKYTDQDGNIRFTDDLSNVPQDQRPDVKSYEEFESTQPPAAPEKKEETGQGSLEQEPETEKSLDAQGEQIREKHDQLEIEYQAIMKVKARLEAEAKEQKTADETVQYNQKILELNKNISQYDQKRKALNAEIEAYNARMAERNKQDK